jgi:hypothetical protein
LFPSFFRWKGLLSHTKPRARYGWNSALLAIAVSR